MKSKEHRRTRHFNYFLLLIAIAGLIAALIAIDPLARASQDRLDHWSGHRGIHRSSMAFCDTRHQDRMEQVSAYVDIWLNLEPVQQAAWSTVAHELERGFARLRDACAGGVADNSATTTPERLALLESAMAAGTETLRAVQPAFAEFYGTLNEEQRRKIDSLPGRHAPAAR